MSGNELAKKVAEETGVKQSVAKKILDTAYNTIENAVAGGDKVAIVGFGTFSKTDRAARTGHNPRTGETIQIAPKAGVKFKAGATFKATVQ